MLAVRGLNKMIIVLCVGRFGLGALLGRHFEMVGLNKLCTSSGESLECAGAVVITSIKGTITTGYK